MRYSALNFAGRKLLCVTTVLSVPCVLFHASNAEHLADTVTAEKFSSGQYSLLEHVCVVHELHVHKFKFKNIVVNQTEVIIKRRDQRRWSLWPEDQSQGLQSASFNAYASFWMRCTSTSHKPTLKKKVTLLWLDVFAYTLFSPALRNIKKKNPLFWKHQNHPLKMSLCERDWT